MTELLEVGRIAKPHGLRGEVIVSLTTDRTERLDAGSVLETDRGPLTVVSAVPHQHRWRVQFEGCASREDADALHGLVLRAEAIDDPDVWFIHELIGLDVVLEDGTVVGTCTAIAENPAYDMVEIDGSILVPMPFVTSVDDSSIAIAPPDGLLDLD
ncbi:ribosome maturation factor RimM [Actinospongicola halichondriae]|uniref:ribosome maturation factor RimM n=1 Tax=Actinospongicola halichondriae TaxID=3236844 RepID=UPI003D55338B